MSASVRYRGVFHTIPGRATINVRVPPDLLAEASKIAHELGMDRSEVLGDLVACALPAALAEAADDLVGGPARERLAGCLPPNAQRPGELTPGRASDPATDAEAIVSPSAAPRGDGGTAT